MAEFKVMEPRKQGVEYYPEHNGDSFYIRTNDTGRNFRLVKAPVADSGERELERSDGARIRKSCSTTWIFSRTITSCMSERTGCRRFA